MANLTMKKVGTAALVVMIAVICALVPQFTAHGFNFSAINLQSLTVDSARLVVIVWLACWAGRVAKKEKADINNK